MVSLIAKYFIDNKSYTDEVRRQKYGTLCSVMGIFLNICLFAFKYFAGVISGSIAIMADAFNNLSDAGSSVITFAGFLFAGKKADADHPFGHGRYEYLSGLAVAITIIVMGVELLKTSVEKIIHPAEVVSGGVAIVILVLSIAVKMYMAYYNRTVGKKIDSAAMEATAVDSLSDCIATSVVLLSLIILKFTGKNIDGYGGIIVSAFILLAGIRSVKDTITPLLGTQPDESFVRNIEETVLSHDEVLGMHDLVVHDYGPGRRMVSLHAEVSGKEDIFVLHDKIDLIEKQLRCVCGCEAVIHMDPIESDNETVTNMRIKVAAVIKEKVDEKITIHDFRMVAGPTHTNLIFDAAVPFDIKLKDDEVKEKIENAIKTLSENYFAVIEIDRVYA
ncbi:MAG: cation transporter [Firmicutes bacterium]|nr:cation transporter [Bacillota bacterium]